jgi:cytochrome c biogenesis protein CcmG, thiol:disulfide interchange protein DsbE
MRLAASVASVAFLACLGLAVAGCAYQPPSLPFNSEVPNTTHDASLGIGVPAAEMHGQYISGRGPTTLAATRGKVTIVDFWASWCAPCLRSFPIYQRLLDEYPDDLAIITVSIDGAEQVDNGDLARFVERTHTTFPVLWDKDGSMLAAYRVHTVPTAYVIGRDGFVRSVHTGYEDREDLRIESMVRLMLGR